jgi:hypothetical protein
MWDSPFVFMKSGKVAIHCVALSLLHFVASPPAFAIDLNFLARAKDIEFITLTSMADG